ncbi:IS66 family insertion sequence element accessory protein TnpA [Citrobacter portucalensis]|uniref:IS66 family insertion sequence element accessory protein TnpA n=1 Tax=Citrobacter portucalensis TaxID=1639133 RepID=UPI00226B1172|nr:IS66 family insertion sequence element accessory protein TnpB [Citrobacter portucalensis]MCX8985966.1 IS66 family insertion sequence element accessory protein TnpB [Citrobacter portucalensis]
MPKKRWIIKEKIQHVASWRASGLTRLQYAELHAIPFKSLRQWPQDIASAERRVRASVPDLLPVSIHSSSATAQAVSPVTLHLPGGYHIDCLTAQLPDVLLAVKHA